MNNYRLCTIKSGSCNKCALHMKPSRSHSLSMSDYNDEDNSRSKNYVYSYTNYNNDIDINKKTSRKNNIDKPRSNSFISSLDIIKNKKSKNIRDRHKKKKISNSCSESKSRRKPKTETKRSDNKNKNNKHEKDKKNKNNKHIDNRKSNIMDSNSYTLTSEITENRSYHDSSECNQHKKSKCSYYDTKKCDCDNCNSSDESNNSNETIENVKKNIKAMAKKLNIKNFKDQESASSPSGELSGSIATQKDYIISSQNTQESNNKDDKSSVSSNQSNNSEKSSNKSNNSEKSSISSQQPNDSEKSLTLTQSQSQSQIKCTKDFSKLSKSIKSSQNTKSMTTKCSNNNTLSTKSTNIKSIISGPSNSNDSTRYNWSKNITSSKYLNFSTSVIYNNYIYIIGEFFETLTIQNKYVKLEPMTTGYYLASFDNDGNIKNINVIWKYEGKNEDNTKKSIKINSEGKIYISLYFTGCIILNNGVKLESDINHSDIIISLTDNYIVDNIIRIKGAYPESLNISISNTDDIYITGFFKDYVEFQDSKSITSNLDLNFFIVKYSKLFEYSWVKYANNCISDSSSNNSNSTNISNKINIQNISIDKKNNILVCGTFTGYIDINDLILENKMSKTSGWIGKLTPNGKWKFVMQSYNKSNSSRKSKNQYLYINDITSDDNNDITIIGQLCGSYYFDNVELSSSIDTIFLCKFDSSGYAIWMRDIEVDVSLSNNVYPYILLNNNNNDFFICFNNLDKEYINTNNLWLSKINSDGTSNWLYKINNVLLQPSLPIISDKSSNNIYVLGNQYCSNNIWTSFICNIKCDYD